MAIQLAPGVYIEELPSATRSIAGVSTAVCLFVGAAARGPTEPTAVTSWTEFERRFGGLLASSDMTYAVRHFFDNGGRRAIIRRIHNGAVAASAWRSFDGTNVRFVATSPGAWGNALRIDVGLTGGSFSAGDAFDLTILERIGQANVVREKHYGLSLDERSDRFAPEVLQTDSERLAVELGGTPPGAVTAVDATTVELVDGTNGNALTSTQYDANLIANIDFNLLVVPFPPEDDSEITDAQRIAFWQAASLVCQTKRAFAIIDPPVGWGSTASLDADIPQATGLLAGLRTAAGREYAAVYFPRVRAPDALAENALRTFGPSGMIAGIYARTDSERGVFKAPAGVQASLSGSLALDVLVDDATQATYNQEGINVLRAFPSYGRVVWGARTIEGLDRLGSEWKYIPVRRTANFLEESLRRGIQWAVFEPNDEPLWSQLRLNVGAFMHQQFRAGAFAGSTPREAYFVKCDAETTPQEDIDAGRVNVVVGWAPLRPAEFVIIRIQQITRPSSV
ncbi:MAG: phage tail sheath C-terminal domain-containing protein [Myxococcota bacterium]